MQSQAQQAQEDADLAAQVRSQMWGNLQGILNMLRGQGCSPHVHDMVHQIAVHFANEQSQSVAVDKRLRSNLAKEKEARRRTQHQLSGAIQVSATCSCLAPATATASAAAAAGAGSQHGRALSHIVQERCKQQQTDQACIAPAAGSFHVARGSQSFARVPRCKPGIVTHACGVQCGAALGTPPTTQSMVLDNTQQASHTQHHDFRLLSLLPPGPDSPAKGAGLCQDATAAAAATAATTAAACAASERPTCPAPA